MPDPIRSAASTTITSRPRRASSAAQASPTAPVFIFFNPVRSPLTSRNDSTEQGFELRTGYDFQAGKLTLGPRLAVVSRKVESDGFAESGVSPMKLVFDAQEEESLQGALGLQLFWVVTLFSICWLVWQRAMRRVIIQGG